MNPGGGLVALTPSPGGGVGRLVAFVGKELLNPEIKKYSKPLLLLTKGEKKSMYGMGWTYLQVIVQMGTWRWILGGEGWKLILLLYQLRF